MNAIFVLILIVLFSDRLRLTEYALSHLVIYRIYCGISSPKHCNKLRKLSFKISKMGLHHLHKSNALTANKLCPEYLLHFIETLKFFYSTAGMYELVYLHAIFVVVVVCIHGAYADNLFVVLKFA